MMDDREWDDPKPCLECGDAFTPTVHNQKRHPPCEQINDRRRQWAKRMQRVRASR